MITSGDMIGIGIVGYGYWGPNLARNFASQQDCSLVSICEMNPARAALAKKQYPQAQVTADYNELLKNNAIHAILIATPVSTHYALAKQALEAGKDVLLEKPMTNTVAEAVELVKLAEKNKRILAVDHTYVFTGAVQKIKQVFDSGELGNILYIDSIRINLGLFQSDVNVIHDLAPHDLSIVNYILNKKPVTAQAMGVCRAPNGMESMAYLHVEYEGGPVTHFHLSWISPVKIRRTLIAGDKKMILYDDLEGSEKIKIYDSGITIPSKEALYKTLVDYRIGDMVSPKVSHREALDFEAEHFISCVKNRTKPMIDGKAGLEVVKLLAAAEKSIRNDGSKVRVE